MYYRWHADLTGEDAFCISSVTPWLRPAEAKLYVADFTVTPVAEPNEGSLAHTNLSRAASSVHASIHACTATHSRVC